MDKQLKVEDSSFLKIEPTELLMDQTYYIYYKYVINNYWIFPIFGTFIRLDDNNAVFTKVKQEWGYNFIDISEYHNGSPIVYNYTDYEFYINLKVEKEFQINKLSTKQSLKEEIIFSWSQRCR